MSFLPLYNIARIKDNKDLPKIAEVINNKDPKGLGRIKVKLDGMFDPDDEQGSNLPWIRKMRSEMGIGIDEKNIPLIGDKVEIIWPYDNKHAFYRGLPFGDGDKISSDNYDWGWVTPNGFSLLVNKSTNSFLISNPQCSISVSSDGALTISTNSSISVTTSADATISASRVEIKGNTKIDDKVFLSHRHSNGNDGNPTGGVL